MKKIKQLMLLTLLCVQVSAATVEEKIKSVDDRIRKEEAKAPSLRNESLLKDLVKQYNKLVQEQNAIHESAKSPEQVDPENLVENHEDALMRRLKEHERRIDELEQKYAQIERKFGGTAQPVMDVAVSHTSASVAAGTVASTQSVTQSVRDDATEQASTTPAPSLNSPAVAQFNQAMALFNTGTVENLKKSAEAFLQITKTYPQEVYSDKAYAHAAQAFHRIGNFDEAHRCYKMAITKPLDGQNKINTYLGYAEIMVLKNNKKAACNLTSRLGVEKLSEEQKRRMATVNTSAQCG